MSFWSGKTLADRLPDLIEGFDPNQIDCAAYTLRVGREVYISPSTAADALTRTKIVLNEGGDFVIPAGQFAFLLTEECVTVPESAVAFISMKARIKFKGLVNVSGFHVDPGYRGRLLFAVFNAGSGPVHLARGDECFLIWYASLDEASEKYSRKGNPFNEIPSDLITPISRPLQSLDGLSDRIGKIEAEQQAVKVGIGIASALFITLLALSVTLLAQSCRPATAAPNASAVINAPAPVPAVSTPVASPPAGSPTSANPTVSTNPSGQTDIPKPR